MSSPHPPGGAGTGGDPSGATPPGWYVDPTGAWRWWDGSTWGLAAAAPPSPNRSLAVLSHLGSVLGGFLLPLVIYLTADRRDRFLRHHAAEGLNFQLTLLLGVGLAVVAMFGAFFLGILGASGGGTGAFAFFGGFFVVWLLIMALSFGGIVLGILGAVRANQGVWWRYPVCIRFVRGADGTGDEGGPGIPVT